MKVADKVEWIAVDWGTSHLRVWGCAGSAVVATAQSDNGMGALAQNDFEPALLDLIEQWLGPTPIDVLCCGMVGARQGWFEAAYRAVPCEPLSAAVARIPDTDPRIAVKIVPGLKQDHPADVMRGEETQIAGFIAEHPGWDGVLCLPGTHTKWVHISAGEVVSFRSFMTGELFALLSQKSVLRHSVTEGWDDAAFLEAVDDTVSRPEMLVSDMFGLRAGQLLHGLDGRKIRSRLSGLLIGAELRAAKPYWLGQNVAIIGAEGLGEIYRAALARQGLDTVRLPAGQLVLAGLAAIRAKLGETT